MIVENHIHATRKFHRRLLLGLALLGILLTFGWILFVNHQTSDKPARSTTEARPNSSQNVPPTGNGSVTESGNEAEPTTPSATGTGDNNLLRETAQ